MRGWESFKLLWEKCLHLSVAKIGFKIIISLVLWLITAQGQLVYALSPEAVQLEEDSGFELKQSTGAGFAYIDQRNTLNIEPGPQKEFPFFSAYSSTSSGFSEGNREQLEFYDSFLRDVRRSLSIQIFPFHFFW